VAAYLKKSASEVLAMPLWEFEGWQARIKAERKAKL
jgi:hypothetical protein